MALNLSHVTLDSRTCQAVFEGESFDVTYKPNEYTQENLDKLGAEDMFSLVDFLLILVTDWDVVTGPKTKPVKYPFTEENLRKLPYPVVKVIFRAITEDASSVGEAEDNSGAG